MSGMICFIGGDGKVYAVKWNTPPTTMGVGKLTANGNWKDN